MNYANEGLRLTEKRNPGRRRPRYYYRLSTLIPCITIPIWHEAFNEVLGLYRPLQDAAGVAQTYNQLGLLDGNNDELNTAFKYYQNSSELIKSVRMGKALEAKDEREKALSYYLRALTQYEHRN